ncbi:uncharacterized membrane protein (DUF2068 family) [Rhodanobacter sp. ANJX3]|uniref:DUF2127 domain-containing protein n=1 Tax=Rhodanobacter sp. ANJX3 TaxID=2723083 RepID=UPI00160FA284|nr:DUF2127 domain-containing protein [Rhodanobacter sp. ANJX3]MBB5360275.1 uncharacterized membrane protein (DUF2068 family) [Rhodanobacter sp. ANJX3]
MSNTSSTKTSPDASHRAPAKQARRESQHGVGLRVIAIYKAVKTVGLILIAIASFHLYKTENFDHLVHWMEHLSLTDSNGLRWKLVQVLEDMGPNKFVAIGMVALAYAAIFATEGIGLWLHKYWAEWFTVFATGSLIPLELYEAIHHFSWLKLAALIANILIVIYLVRIALQSRKEMKNAA